MIISTLLDVGLNLTLNIGINLSYWTMSKSYDLFYYLYYGKKINETTLLLLEIKKLNDKIELMENKSVFKN